MVAFFITGSLSAQITGGNEVEEIKKPKQKVEIPIEKPNFKKHTLLYSAHFPRAIVGCKYAYLGKPLGFYFSAATDLGNTNISYIDVPPLLYANAGLTIRTSDYLNLFIGGGLGPIDFFYPGYWEGNIYYYDYELYNLVAPIAEIGSIIQINQLAIEVGAGYVYRDSYDNLTNYSYIKAGIGFSF